MTNAEFIKLSQDVMKSHKVANHSLTTAYRHTKRTLINFGCKPDAARMFTHFAARLFFLGHRNVTEVVVLRDSGRVLR